MATVKHAKVSGLANPADPTLVGGEDWDDDHDVTLVDGDIPASIARDSEVTAAVAAEAVLARNADNLSSGTVADARIASTIARDAEVASAVSTHAGAADPHGDRAFSTAAVAALSSVYQPLDSDLTALAALTTTTYGRAFLALADAAAARTALSLGTAAVAATGDFDAAGAAAAAQAASQPLDSDLTAIAALTTTSFGRSVLAAANAAALRTLAGTVIGTDVAAFGDSRLSDSRAPNGAAGGDLSGTYPNPSVVDDSHAHTAATLPAAGADLSGIDFLVGTASGLLSGEIPVGTTPGGELGGTWSSPTVDATHSGSTHAAAQAAAESTAAGALSTHAAAADPHPGYLTPAEGNAAYDVIGAAAAAQAASQPLDSDLTAFAGLAIAADKLPYGTGSHTLGLADLTTAGRALIDDADASAQRTTLGLVIGTDVEAHDADLTAIAALSPTNDDIIQRKAGAWTNRTLAQLLTDLALGSVYQPLDSDLTAIAALTTTSYGRSLLALADAAALRTAGGLVIGTDVEAHDADLTTIGGLSPTNDDLLQRKSGAWANRTIAQLLTDLAAAGTTFQPLDSDLTSIAALTTTSFGRGLLALADAAALAANHTHAGGTVPAAVSAAALIAAYSNFR